jgi:hypothetical protein
MSRHSQHTRTRPLAPMLTPHTQLVYFGRAIPWVIIDSMPSMRKYKIQDVSGAESQIRRLALTHFCRTAWRRRSSSGTAPSPCC